MGVIVDKGDDRIFHDMDKTDVCSICERKPHPPLMTWVGKSKTAFILCGQCAKTIKNGFVADLVHLVAVVNLQETEPDYVLVRKHKKVVDAEREQERKEYEKMLNGEHYE